MNIAIIGFGTEGRAAYDYYHAAEHDITVCDQNTSVNLPEGVHSQLGDDYLKDLDRFDVIVRSPFVRPDALVNANSVEILPKVTSNTNEFMRVSPSRNIIGVTGTKGKGTTSSLITAMLRNAGLTVHLGGNIGIAALDLLKEDISPDDWVVLELSSYQLIDLQQSPPIAVCLTVMPEHLDWHENETEYYAAKQQLFRWQTNEDTAVYYADNPTSVEIASAGEATKIPYMVTPGAHVTNDVITIDDQAICDVHELKLLGKHNWQNACAATTVVWHITKDAGAISEALTTFTGLPYRIELRREVNDLRYFNDSFATGPGSSIAAMQAIEGPKVMILGGYDRGLDLSEFVEAIISQGDGIRTCLIIGDSRQRLAEALKSKGYTNFTLSDATTMPEIVSQATAKAEPGDAVVLSPGFASFGLFKNFEDRGNKFNEAVEAL